MTDALDATLVATLWPARSTGRLARDAALVIGGALALAVSAKVQVPFYPVPMTLQTLAVLVLAASYGARLGMAAVALYLVEGLLGAPSSPAPPPARSTWPARPAAISSAFSPLRR